MKTLIAILLAITALSAGGQGLSYTPPASAAYLTSDGTTWSPWTSAAAFGAIPFTPPAIGLYCQASAGAQWTPCAPSSGSGNTATNNTNAVSGGLGHYATGQEGSGFPTIQTQVAGLMPYGLVNGVLTLCSAYGVGELAATGSAVTTFSASFELPTSASPQWFPLTFRGSRTTQLAPQSCVDTDAMPVDVLPNTPVYWRINETKSCLSCSFVTNSGAIGLTGPQLLPGFTGNLLFGGVDGAEIDNPRSGTDGVISGGSLGTFTSATLNAGPNDPDNQITINGVGVAGGALVSNIATQNGGFGGGGNSFTLTTPATSGGTGLTWQITTTDKTVSGGVIYKFGANGLGPIAIRGTTLGPPHISACIDGDSIGSGTGAGSANGSWIVQMLSPANLALGLSSVAAPNIPFANLSQPSDTTSNLLATHTVRGRVWNGCSDVIHENVNDAGQALSAAQGYLLAMWKEWASRGLKIHWATLLPRTTSTDAWLTVGNQTVTAFETVRKQLNDWGRSGAPYTTELTAINKAVEGSGMTNGTYSATGACSISCYTAPIISVVVSGPASSTATITNAGLAVLGTVTFAPATGGTAPKYISTVTETPLATGTTGAYVAQAPYRLANGTVTPPANTTFPHFLATGDVFEVANSVESSCSSPVLTQDGGCWLPDPTNRTITATYTTGSATVTCNSGTCPAAGDVGNLFAIPNANFPLVTGSSNATIATIVDATHFTMSGVAAGTINSGVATAGTVGGTCGAYTYDGLHPDLCGHAFIGAAESAVPLTWKP